MDKEEDSKGKLLDLLLQAGLPPFELDKNGYPIPGKVVKYYREQMKYIDPIDEKQKCWTQADLAKRLGIKELMVRLMETQNKGLDSIERRRALAALLKIPPALLGLASFEQIVEFVSNSDQGAITAPVSVHDHELANHLYKGALNIYGEIHRKHLQTRGSIDEIEYWIARIEKDVKNSPQKRDLLYLLWEFHRIITDVYIYDKHEWNKAQNHTNESLLISRELNDANLQVLSLSQSCGAKILQKNDHLARIDIDAAIAHTKNTSPLVKAIIFAQAARAYSSGTPDSGDRTSASRFLEQSQNVIKGTIEKDDRYIPLRVDVSKCLFTQFDALKALDKTTGAMDVLNQIEDTMQTGDVSRLALLNLKRAKCYASLKRPQYDTALDLLIDSFSVYKETAAVHSLKEIEKTYRIIATSPYGNAPEVIDLGIALRDLKLKKMR